MEENPKPSLRDRWSTWRHRSTPLTDGLEHAHPVAEKPITAFLRTVADGRFLKLVFLAMLGLSVVILVQDYQTLVANAPQGLPGNRTGQPAPLTLPSPGDQTRPYFPRTMPLGPSRKKPDLPGWLDPLDGATMAAPMRFVLGPEGRASAVGTIDPGTADRLKTFMETHGEAIAEITLHSPGGSVSDALAMGRAIRAAGIRTAVAAHGYCASACPLILASGLYRTVGDEAFVGVHQVYALPQAVGTLQTGMRDAQFITALCQQLLVDMGVDLQVWLKASQTPPAQLYVFTPDELTRFRLANFEVTVTKPSRRPAG
ncbi:MAG: hypothetical protein AAGI12_11310 [Pseudomonadota bacterium]